MIASLVLGLMLAVQAPETVAEVRVHGNHVSTDEEILKIAGLTIGAPFTTATIAEVIARLKASRRFDDVDVLKRFASIEDASKIAVVIIVNEGPVRIERPDRSAGPDAPMRVVKRRFGNFMYMPILDGEDGYGFTYGARIAYVGLPGDRTRLSLPLTWGGEKKAGAEFEQTFLAGPISRVQVGVARQRRTNPAFDEEDDRTRAWGRLEHATGPLRVGGTLGWQRVSFAEIRDDLRTIGADVAFDTRLDPLLPRNAVYATASVERVSFTSTSADTIRTRLDGRGYLGLFGQNVLVARVLREDSRDPVPPYLRPLLGGWSTLRGFQAGSFIGDTLVAGSLELRVPVSSPLSVAKLGVSAFVDTGTVYDKGKRFTDQTLRTGIGGSVWITLTAFRMELAVARGRGASTRVNFGGGIAF